MSWLSESLEVVSKGLTTDKAGSLAELHTRRALTQSQYFTPAWVAQGIWEVIGPSVEKAHSDHRCRVPVLDNSVGNGRLLEPAPTAITRLYACDIDDRCIEALQNDASNADLAFEFLATGLESLKLGKYGVAVLNPPFSLHLESPLMKPYRSTCYGKFGPHTSANSHEYALDQALDAAAVVAAVLPQSMRKYAEQSKRLIAEYILPGDTFKHEGANVNTSVFVFAPRAFVVETVQRHKVGPTDEWPALPVMRMEFEQRPKFLAEGIDYSEPVINTPVTGDNTVTLHHHRRRLVLSFACGLVEAKVLNGLLRYPLNLNDSQHRYPKGMRYAGDGKFLLDAYLIQPDPDAAFESTLQAIRELGGNPVVSPTLAGYWKKLKKKHRRAIEPYRHVIKTHDTPHITVTAKRSMLLDQGNTRSPAIKRGQQLMAEVVDGDFRIRYQDHEVIYRRDTLKKLFDFDNELQSGSQQWVVKHEGLRAAFPELAQHYDAILDRLGIDWLWPYQRESLIEQMMKPYGGVAAWQQGTGKARLALALALVNAWLTDGAALIAVESGLLKEMIREIDKIGLSADLWQPLADDSHARPLKPVNLVSYNRLKKLDSRKRSLGKRLRRRFNTVIADEGGILSNLKSQQSRAVTALAPRRNYVLDGTPIGNYPRDLLPIAGACVGQGVAHQPFGIRNNVYLHPAVFNSCKVATRGLDEFRDKHMVLEWATNEFRDDHGSGAKREIPKINNLALFREWIAPFIQRRVRNEPEVAEHASCPDPVTEDHYIDWDHDHFVHYLDVAVNYANEFMKAKKQADEEGRGLNLVALLAKINGVRHAASNPHSPSDAEFAPKLYQPVTSKQRYAIDLIKKYIKEGKKTILYARSPETVERLHALLKKEGIPSVRFHGKRDIATRTQELDDQFRFGEYDVVLSSWVGQRGLNIPQAKRIILYDREWSADTESQAIARTQRPEQDESVIIDRLHLKGAIDEYIGQVADWKYAASDAALDWGDGSTESDVFYHLDSVLERFCHDTLTMSVNDAAKLYGVA